MKHFLCTVFVLLIGPLAVNAKVRLDVSGQRGTESIQTYVRTHTPDLMRTVSEQLGLSATGHIRIRIGRNAREMRTLALREQKSLPPEWAEGLAYPKRGVIYLHADGPVDEIHETLVHELSHIAFEQIDRFNIAPRWFGEGLAVWQSESDGLNRVWLLTKAALADRLFRLAELNRGFPVNGARAEVAYAQAVHFIGFLHDEYGRKTFQALLKRMQTVQEPFSVQVEQTYGMPLGRLEMTWRSSIRGGWGYLALLADSTTLFVLCTVLLIIGWRQRRLERRQRLEQLRRDEAAMDAEIRYNAQAEDDSLDVYDGQPPTYH
ncbi:MAG: peptidase MA family metallohydrolase [Myxococcota bacterium]|nr:peptidase MA family metallohydrolase [Myxococcota bacterium]